jgi:GGDEF domain-containing protein
MKERLDAEIARSASFEQDLSLLVFCYDDLTSHDEAYGSIGKVITEFFSFRDLAFERGDDGFSVILPNIDSPHALRMAEEFIKKLVFLAGGDFAELELLPIYIGISSRAGRLVDAGRLIEEAATALDRARYEKDSHIVAFRPDPDKYRNFLASRGAGQSR